MAKVKTGTERWQQLVRSFLGEDFFDDIVNVNVSRDNELCADVYHTKNEVIIVIDIPGVEDIHSIDIHVDGETLWVKGTIPSPYQGYQSFLVERKQGTFQKMIPLGTTVSEKQSYARYRKGVLEIRFSKLKPYKNKQKIRIVEQG
ncbi:Hsp20/alpha crystallin family protein [Thermoflavimicrobium daqui]|uniref:SHSP domain-containing protein n=1 Tax=Thermoflavimicrobium daqui TaxID=2137476 RepID=A0A364K4L0_9BACL|nr:Hsp20/alpha crystallin family protein [Thermoflavimicrobium daqui]RAL24314.1 hypothetical protein DL897_08255 [Thermoflavimicrobium daqui]